MPNYRVLPSGNGDWKIETTGGRVVVSSIGTKQGAISEIRSVFGKPGQKVIVHGANGQVQRSFTLRK